VYEYSTDASTAPRALRTAELEGGMFRNGAKELRFVDGRATNPDNPVKNNQQIPQNDPASGEPGVILRDALMRSTSACAARSAAMPYASSATRSRLANGSLPSAPATLLDHEPRGPGPDNSNTINDLASSEAWANASLPSGPGPLQGELFNDINWLAGPGPGAAGRPENGAPARAVTGTPTTGAHDGLLASKATPGDEKGAPRNSGQVPVLTGEYPDIEDLF